MICQANGFELRTCFQKSRLNPSSNPSHSLNPSLWFYLEMPSETENMGKSLPKRILYSVKNIVAVMYSSKSRKKIQEKDVGFQDPLWNAVLYITIVLYITNINVEYALGNFDPHRVLGPLPLLYKKASFYCLYSICLLAGCHLCDELSRCQIHTGEWT